MSKKIPIVALVGRANVGKSSLFNAIIGRREAIVANEPGTTRDSISAKATTIDGSDFWLVDTAGMKDAVDDFEFTIQEQIAQAADSADVILVVAEAHVGINDEDRRVAKMALKTRKPVILLVNKADKAKNSTAGFERLGIKTIIATSAVHHTGLEELLRHIDELVPQSSILVADDRIRVAILGRPNVGKSSLFNALSSKQQAVVADRAGTTRDINRTVVTYHKKEIELLDTAGIRRSGKIETGVEQFSVLRSLSAIEQSDICLLLIDATELSVALDQKIAGLIKEAGKGLVLVVSKWDKLDKDAYTRDRIAPLISEDYKFAPWATLIFTSSETGQNVTKIFDIVLEIMNKRAQKLKTAELNRWLKRMTDKHPPAGLKNKQPKLRYMVQEENPIPAFRIYGSQTKFVHWSYRRYLERELRESYDFSGTPLQLWFIDRDAERTGELEAAPNTYNPIKRKNSKLRKMGKK
ncbi:ribosome biogenesis GTPase Der [bacterium]|nr:ribosome biogenesis GTPase Der [bacterium]NBX97916.1 ribosome biogenesis GTPase Der [bacterium]NDD82792.1 ribosome biogenesis GTPase Der [bacterium]NDG28840.1 ribosome biogenesis GTPase Der [bacterium]